MEKRQVVERIVGRMYRHYERSTGRTPDGKVLREMEKRVKRTAELVDNRKERGGR